MDTGTPGSYPPNHVLRNLRSDRKWGRPRLARELHNFCTVQNWSSPGEANIAKQIYRLETGRIKSPDEFYSRLYCQFFGRSAHELFGNLDAGGGGGTPGYRMRSHKFLPVHVGSQAVEKIFTADRRSKLDDQWTDCWRMDYDDDVSLYGWPCGVVMFHIVEPLEPENIAEVAVWRRQTYESNIKFVLDALVERRVSPLNDPYVLSAYWVDHVPLDDSRRETALRLLSIPRVLTGRDEYPAGAAHEQQAHASLVEQALLRDGFDHPDICAFGMRGISTAFASWSGVVYHPTAPGRALAESELVACELSVQAAWAYCDFILQEVENGRDPVISESFGWRYLRGVKSRLTTERPQETSQHRAMREAIISTSGLERRLDQALETLRDLHFTEGGYG